MDHAKNAGRQLDFPVIAEPFKSVIHSLDVVGKDCQALSGDGDFLHFEPQKLCQTMVDSVEHRRKWPS